MADTEERKAGSGTLISSGLGLCGYHGVAPWQGLPGSVTSQQDRKGHAKEPDSDAITAHSFKIQFSQSDPDPLLLRALTPS